MKAKQRRRAEKPAVVDDVQLPRYVDEKYVLERLALSRATLHRQRKKGAFPQPVQLSAGRVAWPLDEVLEWERKLRDARAKHPGPNGVAETSAKPPADLAAAVRAMVAEHLSHALGKPFEPERVVIGYVPDDQDADTSDAIDQRLDALQGALAGLSDTESLAVIYWLFPAYRPVLDDVFANHSFDWPTDPAEWREMAAGALATAGLSAGPLGRAN